jgi:hypothetical protein
MTFRGIDFMFTIDHDLITLQNFKDQEFDRSYKKALLLYKEGGRDLF